MDYTTWKICFISCQNSPGSPHCSQIIPSSDIGKIRSFCCCTARGTGDVPRLIVDTSQKRFKTPDGTFDCTQGAGGWNHNRYGIYLTIPKSWWRCGQMKNYNHCLRTIAAATIESNCSSRASAAVAAISHALLPVLHGCIFLHAGWFSKAKMPEVFFSTFSFCIVLILILHLFTTKRSIF